MSLLPTLGLVAHTLRHELAARLRRTWRSASRSAPAGRPLRIGVDIRPFYEPLTGVGWYLYYLLHELAKREDVELVLFGDARVTDLGPSLHAELPANAQLCVFDLCGRSLGRLDRAITAAAYVAWIELAGCDVFFAANYFLPRLHAAVARKRVITIHDLTFQRFPELLQKETLENLGRQMTREIVNADAIVCVSESTRRDLLRYYPVDPARATAIHSGLGTPAAAAPLDGLPPRYLLFVSTIEPRKNLETLLDAYGKLRDRGAYDGALVVVGKVGWKSDALVPRLHTPGVVHLDYLPSAQLATVYENAEVFVFPSIYEGFGFPLLEAMARGVPSIAARSSSLPEIGGDAALYFDPLDVDALAAQIERVVNDDALRDELARKGRVRAAGFRWEDAAAATLEVLRRAANV
jgi:glycosyltransferase involved in cell wall biosynthesis